MRLKANFVTAGLVSIEKERPIQLSWRLRRSTEPRQRGEVVLFYFRGLVIFLCHLPIILTLDDHLPNEHHCVFLYAAMMNAA